MPPGLGTRCSQPSTCRSRGATAPRAKADVPEQVRFAAEPHLASRMIAATVIGGLPCRWATGDEAYGNDPQLAARLRQRCGVRCLGRPG